VVVEKSRLHSLIRGALFGIQNHPTTIYPSKIYPGKIYNSIHEKSLNQSTTL